jgi:16S rRNA (guanine527-N7)-methyltransferase
MGNLQELKRLVEDRGFSEPEVKADRLFQYLRMVQTRREWAGLVSRGLPVEASIDQSLAVAQMIEGESPRLADLGSGGGLLGIVVAIACPDARVDLVESLSRKAAFLAEVIGRLDLENSTVINKRAEKLVKTGDYDYVTSRAAGKLEKLAPIALGLLKTGGRYLALKSSDPEEEIDDAMSSVNRSGGSLVEKRDVAHGSMKSASLVVIEKL